MYTVHISSEKVGNVELLRDKVSRENPSRFTNVIDQISKILFIKSSEAIQIDSKKQVDDINMNIHRLVSIFE